MGLASALNTALTGMGAAETTIDVIGNNLANSGTVGFKASTATFATQFSQTLSLGSAASANNGGTDPEQIGLGTLVAQITQNFGQGTISTVSTTSDMAIQGNGFFVMQGATGGQLYTPRRRIHDELQQRTGQRHRHTTCSATAPTRAAKSTPRRSSR